MGCIRLLPGSHVIGQRPHRDTFSPGNLLSRGQTIEHRLDYSNTVMMPLKAGQVSLHHTHIVHSSEPNRTNRRRIGIGVSYIPPHCRLVNDVRVTASLVRGRDDYGHFDPEPRPSGDFDAGSRAVHAAAVERFFEFEQAAGGPPQVGQRRNLIWRLRSSPPAATHDGFAGKARTWPA